ncbi:MAG: helix-turn-helix transcriptional regulator [Clostridia bacterium]|nr:helix-turn-helix transcriptional regulator [Clostridia bacterium]
MSIGQRIYELRTKNNLSQEALAERLEVSRQSVSKWETDAAVPDLDKLIRLSDVFEVSLDELTERKQPPAAANADAKNPALTQQKIIGYILLGGGILFALIYNILYYTTQISMTSGNLVFMLIILPMLGCGGVCLFIQKKAAYWCCWLLYWPLELLTVLTMAPLSLPAILGRLVLEIALAVIALHFYKNTAISFTKRSVRWLLFAWIGYIAVFIGLTFLIHYSVDPVQAYITTVFLADLAAILTRAHLYKHTVFYFKNRKKAC